ncbi:sigma-54 interaction domain-containing protein [Pseudobacter ginsenosidimutans]|uniref:Sigma-54 interacting transcriptional regulator n=1 Tax=Pseudobacter ginsenosidimutans TaxID=661488 RepID=A0A4Q7MNG0_9BACT|nr:sigma-54 dependent transcriptional regulator [Pseudobacter ginsenosidimutans]QEC40279.1 sigma-54-dependent Fis family transcriptional regulator [Pseudobacter ginsenosidimutans]RZS69118.1 sigma-54 interacting transcriptional regulator [Pseudobacter ginsenosidimutans]
MLHSNLHMPTELPTQQRIYPIRTSGDIPKKLEIVGNSEGLQEIQQLITTVAPSESTVLILGETGTGKEMIARAIHNRSSRVQKVMVKVNCAALPANLIESELFGHERGSFTGAFDRRIGKFELAQGGTIFLDEIGEMPVELQVKLLRVLQEKELERIGGKTSIKVDVRIVAATNRDLEKEMAQGRFRPDLYYRLNVFPITVLPLRERRSDIPALAAHFLQKFAGRENKQITKIPDRYMAALMNYNWPGNIRELENVIERSVLMSTGKELSGCPLLSSSYSEGPSSGGAIKTIAENEKEHILKALSICNHKLYGPGGAAELLGINASTLKSRMNKLGIGKKFMAGSPRMA